MKFTDILSTAFGNTGRSKMRTFLTVLAIFIGAFTLTLTSGIGAGVNNYITKMAEGSGQQDQLFIQSASPQANVGMGSGDGPVEYDADGGSTDQYGIPVLTDEDIEAIREIDHVATVEPVVWAQVEYLEVPDGTKYQVSSLGFPMTVEAAEVIAGATPDPNRAEILIPESWVEAFGHEEGEEAELVGEQVTLALLNQVGEEQTVEATVSGVAARIVSGVGNNPVPSQSLYNELNNLQRSGLGVEPERTYIQAVAVVKDIETNVETVKQELADLEMLGLTLEDQLGVMEGVISAITWVFNGFALIALLAASFGIINTLLMSVQERTREIGLMKALGMTNGRIFLLFSAEAVVLGVMGSVLGILLGLAFGWGGNALLTAGPLSAVAGLEIFAVDPLALVLIFLLIVLIAFLAGVLPARRAAKKHPIEALRHE